MKRLFLLIQDFCFHLFSEFLLLRGEPVISSLNKLKESHNVYNIDRKGKLSFLERSVEM